MPRPVSLVDLTAEVQADLAETERDTRPLWEAALRSGSGRLKSHVLLIARLVKITRDETRDLAIAAEKLETAEASVAA